MKLCLSLQPHLIKKLAGHIPRISFCAVWGSFKGSALTGSESCLAMQVLPCSKRFCHDWTVCPYAHPGEKAKRRDPRVHSYTGIACPNMKKVGQQLSSRFVLPNHIILKPSKSLAALGTKLFIVFAHSASMVQTQLCAHLCRIRHA